MNYAWVIDQTRCIGCHACSTACKSENDVPLGVYRTWVKNVEVGSFPNVRRHFAVLRCNHCADPPCVHICPVRAMFQRPDGIVDIDHDRCIGCKACMQACPYDAIHMDPTTDTAAKCHFCAHRVDRGLLPACVVICPVEALVFGDLDDPQSKVSRIVGSTSVTVRRPEQGTRPKAFYVAAHHATLDPLAATHDSTYMWSDRVTDTAKDSASDVSVWSLLEPRPRAGSERSNNGGNDKSRPPRARLPKARVAYDVAHIIPWRGRVSGYLWTKSIASGVAFVAALGTLFWNLDPAPTVPVMAMIALALTGVLLIADLKRPERFWFILAKPQWRSWLTRGAFLILAYGMILTAWLAVSALGGTPPGWIFVLSALLAVGVAVYTALLFGQCEGRDLWQSPLLGLSLAAQMVVAGAATLILIAMASGFDPEVSRFAVGALGIALAAHLVLTLAGEIVARHGSSNAAAAAWVLTRGKYALPFWSSLLIGTAAPLTVVSITNAAVPATVAALLSLVGLAVYEHAFVMAGQSVPIS